MREYVYLEHGRQRIRLFCPNKGDCDILTENFRRDVDDVIIKLNLPPTGVYMNLTRTEFLGYTGTLFLKGSIYYYKVPVEGNFIYQSYVNLGAINNSLSEGFMKTSYEVDRSGHFIIFYRTMMA